MENSNSWHIPWVLFVSEPIGTALLVLVGLSLVILFGTGPPMARLIPSERRACGQSKAVRFRYGKVNLCTT
jgi:hypothetical protein